MAEKQSAKPTQTGAHEKPRPVEQAPAPEQAPDPRTAAVERAGSTGAATPPPDHPTINNLRRAALQRVMRRSGNRSVEQLLRPQPPAQNQQGILQRQPAVIQRVPLSAWPATIPDAPPGTKVTVKPAAPGKDPTATVTLPEGAQGGETVPDERQQEIDELCSQIAANRAGINERFMVRVQGTINKETGVYGYMYTPERERMDQNAEAGDRDAAKEYMAWLSTAQPSAIANAGGAAALTGRLKAQFELWQDIGSEGQTAAMNTWDGENITWGRGFSASGQLQSIMTRLFQMVPGAMAEFLNAGIALEGGQFLVADTQRKIKYKADNAERYIKVDRKLVSVFINVAQNPQHRQAVLDLNWQQFVKGTGNIPEFALGWGRQARAVAGHNVHGGSITWANFAGCSGTLASVVAVIGRRFGKVSEEGGIVVSEKVTDARLKNLARGYALAALGTPIRWGWTYVGPNPLNPPEMTRENKEQFKQSGFTPPKIYFATSGGNSYYILEE